MIKDIDGNKYNTMKIGKQVWTLQNLNVEHYRNGDLIPKIKDVNKLQESTEGAWCHFWNDKEKDEIFGKLYNWYAVNDSRGLAPEGWHIPDDKDWLEFIKCYEFKYARKFFREFISDREFNLNRSYELIIGYFELFTKIGKYLSSSNYDDDYISVIHFNLNTYKLNRFDDFFKKNDYFYVRCIKD